MLAKDPRFADIEKIEQAAMERDRRDGPFRAEIRPDMKPAWYAVTVHPNHEQIARFQLVARGIGVLHPQFPVDYIYHGQARRRMRSLIPGYLFIFVWGIELHTRRILKCSGVSGIVKAESGGYCMIDDAEIDKIRRAENEEWPLVTVEEVIVRRRRRKKYTQTLERRETPITQGEIVSCHAGSYWNEKTELAHVERIGNLKRALGLAS